MLNRATLGRIENIDGVKGHTRSFLQPGKSPVYSFSLAVDAADWHETQPIINSTSGILSEAAAPCGLTGTPAIVFEMQSRIDKDLRAAIALAVILAPLMLALVWLAGLMSVFGFSESPSLIRFGSQASLALIGCLIVTLTVLPTIARRLLPVNAQRTVELAD